MNNQRKHILNLSKSRVVKIPGVWQFRQKKPGIWENLNKKLPKTGNFEYFFMFNSKTLIWFKKSIL